jgi:hypothetical protein
MPVKSKKQRKFMAAVANNPKFAKKVGVSKSVGEEFMKKSTKKMMGGGMTAPAGGMGAMGGAPMGGAPMGGAPMSEEEKRKRAMMAKMAAASAAGGGAAPAAPSMGMKKGGQAKAYKKGGKVRGSGCATKGTRAAKMVTMKGS